MAGPSLLPGLLLALTTLLATVSSQSIVETPSDMGCVAGQKLNFTCRVQGDLGTETFDWNEYITDSTGNRIFSDPEHDPINSNKYEIFGRYDLSLKNPTWRDGGTYGCRLTSQSKADSAHLYVFDPHVLTLGKMSHGDISEVACEARFGAARDVMLDDMWPEMSFVLGQTTVTPTKVINTRPAGSDQPYTIRGSANYTAQKDHDDTPFTCIVTTTLRPSGFQASFSQPLDIVFEVETPQFMPNKEIYNVDEYINCSANGNPEPQYIWVALEGPAQGSEVIGSRLVITEEMRDPNDEDVTNRWQCTATNNVGVLSSRRIATKSAEITFTVYANPDTPGESKGGVEGWVIGVAVAVPLAVICIVVAIVVGLRMSKKRQKEKSSSATGRKAPPPDMGAVNNGAAFPGDTEIGSPGAKVSSLPNPLPEDVPANRSRDSPGYADLGVKQINNSYPGVNVSMNSVDSFDDSTAHDPPAYPDKNGGGRANPSYQSGTPPAEARNQRPNYLNVGPNQPVTPNHPDTFV